METKKELSSLLTKYIPDRQKYQVTNANHKIGIMKERMNKATSDMRKCNQECKFHFILVFRFLIAAFILIVLATRKSVRELENYKEVDKFNTGQFERDLMAASRIKYDDPAGLKAKLVYTDVNFATGYEVRTEFTRDSTNKGL